MEQGTIDCPCRAHLRRQSQSFVETADSFLSLPCGQFLVHSQLLCHRSSHFATLFRISFKEIKASSRSQHGCAAEWSAYDETLPIVQISESALPPSIAMVTREEMVQFLTYIYEEEPPACATQQVPAVVLLHFLWVRSMVKLRDYLTSTTHSNVLTPR